MIGLTSTAVTDFAPDATAVSRSTPPPEPITNTRGFSSSAYWTAIRPRRRCVRLSFRPSQREIMVFDAESISISSESRDPLGVSRTATRENEFHFSYTTSGSSRPRK
jgi:hypothetical protein